MGKTLGRLLRILAWLAPVYQFRASAHRKCGVKIGKGVFMGYMVHIDSEHPELVEIGDWVSIGPGVKIMAHSGASPFHQRTGSYSEPPAKVIVEDGAWIATGAIILPGVRIGRGAIVAAGAVVSRDVPPMTLVAGNPARAVQKLEVRRSGHQASSQGSS
ncbi:MAG: acyltransferase [Candidatus Thorarchaeota archaeon]|nr:acyltransferase [Candidatus Thorarchaeota archaeon]